MRLPLVLLSLLAAGLAGCVDVPAALPESLSAASPSDVAARLSPRLGDLPIVHEVLDVETPEGLVNVDLYRPEAPAGTKLAVILVASPYNTPHMGGKDGERENWIDLPLYDWMREELLPRGYALAQMDVLGTRNSGGCMGIMSPGERRATAAVVDWLGAQEWTNGKVGMIGKSYLGLTQIGAALENPERLATIVPISAPTQDYAYHYANGVPYLVNALTNFAYGAFSLLPPDGSPATYGPRYAERLPCYPESAAASVATLGDYAPRWQERDYRPLVPQVRPDVSMFFIHGLQDWNVKPDHVLGVYNEWPGPKMALLGQWHHDYPNANRWDEGAHGEREDWYFTLHRWFDHWLMGIDTGLMREAEACPVQSQGSDGVWRCLQAFPPLAQAGDPVEPLRFHPDASGSLGAQPGEGAAAYRDDTFVSFSTEPFTQPTRFAGTPSVNLSVSTTSAFNTYLVAALGVESGGRVREVDWGFLSLRHREGLERGVPVVPGTAYDVGFPLYPLDLVVKPGERLVLVLRGQSDAPNFGIQPSPTPGLHAVDLTKSALTMPMTSLGRSFTPLAPEALPEGYLHEEGE